MPMAATAEQVYLRAKGRGLGDKSSLATLLLYEEEAGITLEAGAPDGADPAAMLSDDGGRAAAR